MGQLMDGVQKGEAHHLGVLMKSRRRVNTSNKGFTLIELLVTISIIGVLLGIALPSLRAVRRSASSMKCRSNLMTIGQLYQYYANDHDDLWPNLFPIPTAPGQPPYLDFDWGSDGWRIRPGGQITWWAWPLRDYLPGNGPEVQGTRFGYEPLTYPSDRLLIATEAFSCPVVFDAFPIPPNPQPPGGRIDPQMVAENSFLHSPALFTRADVWVDRSQKPNLDRVTSNVRHSDVAHPSQKAALVEAHTHHGPRVWEPIGDSPTGSVNILAADSHVELHSVNNVVAPMGFVSSFSFEQYSGAAIPFLSTYRGFLGTDW